MFKFGRGYKHYDSGSTFIPFVTGQTFVSGMTMNYMISVDPAVTDEFTPRQNVTSRYATKIVNPNYYGLISHTIRWDDEL